MSPFLKGVPLSSNQVSVRSFRPKQIVSDKPGGVSSVGLVVSGQVMVYSVAIDGKEVQLNSLSPGECFGICNLLITTELKTVLQCVEETSILYIPKTTLLSCMKSDAKLSLRFASLCNTKIQFLLHRIELLTMQSCRARLAAHLLEWQNEEGIVHLIGSRDDLACRLGMSRAALFRELSALQSMKVVAVEGNVIAIKDGVLLEEQLCGLSSNR